MPLFMDRHDIPGVTAKDLAQAHQLDLAVQEKYSCKAHTYWFDEGKGIAFCLIEAADKQAVEEMHRNSHGFVPNRIIEVEGNIVELFLGRILDPEVAESSDKFENFINETAFRTIIYTDIVRPLVGSKKNNCDEIINRTFDLIQNAVKNHYGREVKNTSEGMMASFTSVSNSINCAVEIQNILKDESKLKPAIGLSTGNPVTERDDFFGDAILLAKRLSEIADDGQVAASASVNEFYNEGKFSSIKTGTLKILEPNEEKFLTRLMEITENVWNDSEYNIDSFSKDIGLSKAQLYRKTISLTGLPPNEFIKKYRLKKALKMIEKKNFNISEIAFETGFGSPSYFSKCFQKRFGILPSDYAGSFS